MKYKTIPTARLTRAEWLELRRIGLGGSDAGHVILTPEQFRYADPGRVWREKVLPLPPEEESLPCAIGTALEPLCASLFERATGRRVRRMNQLRAGVPRSERMRALGVRGCVPLTPVHDRRH